MADLEQLDKALEAYKNSMASINAQLEDKPKKFFNNGEYCIWLISIGEKGAEKNINRKLEVMAKIHECFGKGLAINKKLVENLPSVLEINLNYEDCLSVQDVFNSIDCETKILKVNEPLYEGSFKIELLDAGEDRIEALKKIKDYLKVDNASALRMLNNLPLTIEENVPFEQCLKAQTFFDANICEMKISKIEVIYCDGDKEKDAHEFELVVNSNTERTYTNMAKKKTEAPYLTVPADIENRKLYSNNRKKYIDRINKEQKEFNNSLNLIVKKRKDRLRLEEDNRIKRELNRKKFFFVLSQLLITFICVLPILFIDYVGIKYIIANFSGNAGHWIEDWMVKEGYPGFLAYVLQIPVWVGVAYIGLAAIIKKISKKAYTEANFKKYAQSRWVLMLILSIVEAIVSCICLGL